MRTRALWMMFLAATVSGQAHELITTKITWTKEISRLVYARCASCHREGGKAPMSLMTYEEARPWAKAIKEEVLMRRMPPGSAVKGFGDIVNDHSLTQDEVTTIAEWVEGGAPEGNQLYLPKNPSIPDAKEPVRPAGTVAVTLNQKLKLAARTNLMAIRPVAVADQSDLQVIALLPDGTVEPLLWLKGFKKDFARTYRFREPLTLPAGTEIQVVGTPRASLSLYVKGGGGAPKKAASAGGSH